jgi:hypothetical protein
MQTKPHGQFFPILGTRLFIIFAGMPSFLCHAQYIEYPMPNCRAIYINVDGDKEFVSKAIKKLLPKCGSIDFDILSEKKYLSHRYDAIFDSTQIVLFSTVAGVDIEDIKFC